MERVEKERRRESKRVGKQNGTNVENRSEKCIGGRGGGGSLIYEQQFLGGH